MTATGVDRTPTAGVDRTTATAGATDTGGAYESKPQKLLELRVTDCPGGAKGSTVELHSL